MNANLPEVLKNEPLGAASIFDDHINRGYRNSSRMFAVIMPLQWITSILIAYFLSPLTWSGLESSVHPHFWAAIILGGLITVPPVFLAIKFPCLATTRYSVAICQLLMSALLIHLTGGRIETHLHVFGSLAFLSFYRDWRILIAATAVTTFDHVFRGWFYPQSMYGVLSGAEWRWVEHAAWVIFLDICLLISCRNSLKELWEIATNSAELKQNEYRLSEAREFLNQVVDNIPNLIFVKDEAGRYLMVNSSFAATYGKTNERLIGKTDAEVMDDPEKAEQNRKEDLQILENWEEKATSEEVLTNSGNRIWFDSVKRPILDISGSKKILGVCTDVTQRKLSEIEANESKMFLRTVIDNLSSLVFVKDIEGNFALVNQALADVFGTTTENLVGKTDADFSHNSDEAKKFTEEDIKTLRNLADKFIPEEKHTDSKGNVSYYQTAKRSITLESNGARYLVGIATDVTNHKQAQVELREAQNYLRNVIDSIPSLVFVKDSKGRFTLANSSLADLYGTSVENLVGKTDSDFSRASEEVEKIVDAERRIVEEREEILDQNEQFTDCSGNVRWMHTVRRPMIGENGVEYIIGVAADVTERKILESQLRHSQKLESIGQLAAGIAHEINTPTQYVGDNTRFIQDSFKDINGVLEKYSELLNAAKSESITPELIADVEKQIENSDLEYITEEVPNAVQQSLDGISRIASIVQSMKDFAHPGSDSKMAADINRAIESTITVARNEWKYVADLETNFDATIPLVPVFLGELNQVILNMVTNASHSIAEVVGDGSRGKGKISITTTKASDEWAEIRISDNGTGIPEDIQSRIFDPFFTTKEVGKGTGQGLAISHTVIVEKHKGHLSVESEIGKGTTFTIKLPLTTDGGLEIAGGQDQ